MRSASIALLVTSLAFSAARAEAAPPATDRYGHMHMKYEKTWLGVDVANVDVWVDEATSARFRDIAAGQHYSDALADQIGRAALESKDMQVQLVFLRNASLGEFLDAAHKNLEHARNAGYISQAEFAGAWADVQRKFAPLAKRGFKKGDKLLYRARPGSLHTTVMAKDRVLIDINTPEDAARRAMIGGYFARGSDFRKSLVTDLLRSR